LKLWGPGVSEEKEGPESGSEGIGTEAEAKAHFARAAALDLSASDKSELAKVKP